MFPGLPIEILYNEIFKHLNPIDIYNFNKLSTYYRKSVTLNHLGTCLLNIIDLELYKIFHTHLQGFKDVLRETSAVISGSFILKCFLQGNSFENSDIDIYVPIKGNIITHHPSSIVDDFIHHKVGVSADEKDFMVMCNKINWVRRYDNKTKIIGIYVDKDINIVGKFIDDNFDMNICKNIYHINQTGNSKISCKYLQEIFNRKTSLRFTGDFTANFKRYEKYTSRGFKFSNIIGTPCAANHINFYSLIDTPMGIHNNQCIIHIAKDTSIAPARFLADECLEVTFCTETLEVKFPIENNRKCSNKCPCNFFNPPLIHYHTYHEGKGYDIKHTFIAI